MAYPVPEINTSKFPLIRCENAKCRSYANPFMEWSDHGRSWKCPMCASLNRVDTNSLNYAVLDPYGRRTDLASRPEFTHGCVEYIAPQHFIITPPASPAYIFMIETTAQAFDSGLVHTAAQSISAVLKSGAVANEGITRVALVLFDISVSVVTLNLSANSFTLLTVADSNDPFLPAPLEDVLFDLKSSTDTMTDFLTNCLVSESFRNSVQNSRESCLGSALKVADLIAGSEGAHAIAYVASPPALGPIKTNSARNLRSAVNTEKETSLLKPDGNATIEMAKNFFANGKLAVSLFLAPHGNTFLDVANLSPLARLTGGDLHYFPLFSADAHGRSLYENTYRILTRKSGNDLTLRIRCSRGWNVSKQIGPALMASTQDGGLVVTSATTSEDQSFAAYIDFAADTQVAPENFITIQIASLFTRSDQVRVIRVCTKRIPTGAVPEEIFNSIDSAAAVHAAAVLCSEEAIFKPSNPAEPIKSLKVSNGALALSVICQRFAASVSPSLLQSKGREICLYALGALKCNAFKVDVAPDARSAFLHKLQTTPMNFFSSIFYPRLISLHNLEPEHGNPDASTGAIMLPAPLAPTRQSMQQGGIYLLDDSDSLILFISADSDPSFCEGVFGQPFHVVQANAGMAASAIGCTQSDLGLRVRSLMDAVRIERAPCSPVTIVAPQGVEGEKKYFERLVLDPVGMGPFEGLTFDGFMHKLMPMGARNM